MGWEVHFESLQGPTGQTTGTEPIRHIVFVFSDFAGHLSWKRSLL